MDEIKKDFNQHNDLPAAARELMAKRTDENWDKYLDTLEDLALGLWYEDHQKDKDGNIVKVRTYQQKPDKEILQYMANQHIGKPKEAMNIEGKVNLILDA